jgi:hypothetical protein
LPLPAHLDEERQNLPLSFLLFSAVPELDRDVDEWYSLARVVLEISLGA